MHYRDSIKAMAMDELYKLEERIIHKFRALGIYQRYTDDIVKLFSEIRQDKERQIDEEIRKDLMGEGPL